MAKFNWHLNPGSLRVSRKCLRPMQWIGESQKFKTVLSSIGAVILKVCEGPESVTEKWNGLGRVCVCVGMCVCACVCV